MPEEQGFRWWVSSLDFFEAWRISGIVGGRNPSRYSESPYFWNQYFQKLGVKGVFFAFDAGGWGLGNRNVRTFPQPAALSVAYGLSEEGAIKALTINPARILGIDDQVGSFEVGKTANVVIWDGSPLQMRSRVHKVFINGPLDLKVDSDFEKDLIYNVTMVNSYICDTIMHYPDQWVWMHRRWRRQAAFVR